MLNQKLTGQQAADKTYIEDVFSTYLYTGNGSTQTIINGIDLAGKGGMVWVKGRHASSHFNFDTVNDVSKYLSTNNTSALSTATTGQSLYSFNSNGFSVNEGAGWEVNANAKNYASWTFRKAPKFFDVVTYTGNGVNNRQISHNLGVSPGMVIVKCTNTTGNWPVWSRGYSGGATQYNSYLNLTNDFGLERDFSSDGTGVMNASTFCVNASGTNTNTSGNTYVAYLFAHDTSTDGLIQCGSFTTDASGNATVNLGREPQYVMVKASSTTGNWITVDNMRGTPVGSADARLYPNLNNAEAYTATLDPTATGFNATTLTASTSYIYMAIRRPMKVPTDGTKVFAPVISTSAAGTQLTTGFPIDLQVATARNSNYSKIFFDRLRGVSSNTTSSGLFLTSTATDAEVSYTGTRSWGNTGFQTPTSFASGQMSYWNFKRAPGFFDVVCYTGTGSARTVNHNLGVAPELMIVKSRSSAYPWDTYAAPIGNNTFLRLNSDVPKYSPAGSGAIWNNTSPTATVFTVGTDSDVNNSGSTYVAYLFASCPSVSKVGTYTGNGSSQTINCGFAAGARFVMIKRTDSTGDWYVWDTARGIVAGNDPHLSLNNTTTEVTSDDTIDPDSSGFIVNQVSATNVNVSGASYIYLAIA